MGTALMMMGLLATAITPAKGFGACIGVLGGLLGLTGFIRNLSVWFFKKAYDQDHNILLQLERIGEPKMVFTAKWNEQFEMGKHIKDYRIGMVLEAIHISLILLILACFFLVIPVGLRYVL